MWLLQRAVGYQRAAAAALLSQVWGATRAVEFGLAVQMADDPVAAAEEMVAPLGDLEPGFARRLTAVFRDSWTTPTHAEALEAETVSQMWSATQPGFIEGVEAIKAGIAGRARRAAAN
jgi:enoyl-CoA hydratase